MVKSTTQGLTDIVELCERLGTSEEMFRTQGEGNCQTTKSVQSKGSNQDVNPLKEDANGKKNI